MEDPSEMKTPPRSPATSTKREVLLRKIIEEHRRQIESQAQQLEDQKIIIEAQARLLEQCRTNNKNNSNNNNASHNHVTKSIIDLQQKFETTGKMLLERLTKVDTQMRTVESGVDKLRENATLVPHSSEFNSDDSISKSASSLNRDLLFIEQVQTLFDEFDQHFPS